MRENVRRKIGAYLGLFCVLSMMFIHQRAYAQAVLAPVETYVVNRAIGGIIANRVAMARGVAANDATWLATAANDSVYKTTMAGVSRTMTTANVASTALGVGLAVAGAPVWLTIAASLGVIGIGAAIVAGNTKIEIAPTANGNQFRVTKQPGAVTPPAYNTGLVQIPSMKAGAQIYRDGSCYASESTCMFFPLLPSNVKFPYRWKPYPQDNGQWAKLWAVAFTFEQFELYHLADLTGGDRVEDSRTTRQHECYASYDPAKPGPCTFYRDTYWNIEPHWEVNIDGVPRLVAAWGSDLYMVPDNPNSSEFPVTYGYPTSQPLAVIVDDSIKPLVNADLTNVYSSLKGTTAMDQAVAPETLAKLADAAWRNAASKPDYQGLPYSATNPITAGEAASWLQANPSANPTLHDLFTPAQNPTTDPTGVPISHTIVYVAPTPTSPTDPVANGNVNVINTPNVNVVNTVKVDFGPDPNVAAPGLEATPTGAQILQPLTNLFPELRSFSAPQHVGSCPKPTFDVFGQSIVMDAQCTIAEQHRAALAAVMLATWMLLGLFILLSA